MNVVPPKAGLPFQDGKRNGKKTKDKRFSVKRFLILVALLGLTVALASNFSSTQTRADGIQSYQPGWNIIALPPGSNVAVTSSLYTFQGKDTQYEVAQPTQTQSGFGYWAYFASVTTPQLAAGTNSATVTAPAGQYVMVGNPSGTQVATVTGADQILTYNPVAQQYSATITLAVGQGAWAYSANGGTITITATGPAQPLPTATPSPTPSPSSSPTPIALAPCARSSTGLQLTFVGTQPHAGHTDDYIFDVSGLTGFGPQNAKYDVEFSPPLNLDIGASLNPAYAYISPYAIPNSDAALRINPSLGQNWTGTVTLTQGTQSASCGFRVPAR